MRNRKLAACAMVVAAIVAIAVVAIAEVRSGPTSAVPADDPTPTEGLGIFAPVAGRIKRRGRALAPDDAVLADIISFLRGQHFPA